MRTISTVGTLLIAGSASASTNFTDNILVTGDWPPTNEGVRQFSQNLDQNPGGWQGGN